MSTCAEWHSNNCWPKWLLSTLFIYYRKRGSVSYIVREVHSVREREREIQREKDGSDVTIVALKLATSFALFLAKKFAPQFLPS